MKTVVVLVLLLSVAYALDYDREFVSWMQKYKKSYGREEFQHRFSVFKSNLDFITGYKGSATLGLNQFADLTTEEFAAVTHRSVIARTEPLRPKTLAPSALPDSWDWRTKGAVTEVRNQNQCGSCWAFAALETVEACHFITTGTLVSLSAQELIDCDNNTDQGCNGGLVDTALQAIEQLGGLDTEACYPYTAEDGTCKFNPKPPCCAATLTGYADVAPAGSESALQQAVYLVPTSIAIDASESSFQFYTSGVYYEPACSTTNLDHTALAVGWGHDQPSGMDYWIVKNSWGTSWGMQGYVLMARNKSNNCGVASDATYATGCPNCKST